MIMTVGNNYLPSYLYSNIDFKISPFYDKNYLTLEKLGSLYNAALFQHGLPSFLFLLFHS